MTREQVKQLRKAADALRLQCENMQVRNIAGLTLEERIDLDAEYRMAKDQWFAAEGAYTRAMDEWLENKP